MQKNIGKGKALSRCIIIACLLFIICFGTATNTYAVTKPESLGETKIVTTWHGYDIYLSHSTCRFIIDNYEIPSCLVGLIEPTAAAAICISANILKHADKGKGVIVKLIGVPLIGSASLGVKWTIPWIKSQ
jgi:hypothetical protein